MTCVLVIYTLWMMMTNNLSDECFFEVTKRSYTREYYILTAEQVLCLNWLDLTLNMAWKWFPLIRNICAQPKHIFNHTKYKLNEKIIQSWQLFNIFKILFRNFLFLINCQQKYNEFNLILFCLISRDRNCFRIFCHSIYSVCG